MSNICLWKIDYYLVELNNNATYVCTLTETVFTWNVATVYTVSVLQTKQVDKY